MISILLVALVSFWIGCYVGYRDGWIKGAYAGVEERSRVQKLYESQARSEA